MDALDPYLRLLRAPRANLGFWLRRPSGYQLLIVTTLEDQRSIAFLSGMRNGDVVLRINGLPAWQMSIGDALMAIAPDDSDGPRVAIEWLCAQHATLAVRVVRSLGASATTAGSTTSTQSAQQRMRARDHENQSSQQIVRHRARNRHAAMSEAQTERHRERIRTGTRSPNAQLEFAEPCPHCGFRFLRGESRSLCCGGGKATQPPFPVLHPLPPNIRRVATNLPRHFAEQSFQYNNVVAFAIIGVDNGNHNTPGFVRPPGGPHCVKVHGRTYQRIARADGRRNAIRYFVYDAVDEYQQHGASRGLNDSVLQAIHQDLVAVNRYARELRQLGRELAEAHTDATNQALNNTTDNRQGPPLAIRLTARTNPRDIGAVIIRDAAAVHTQTPSSIMIHLRNEGGTQYLQGDDPQRDPLAYPLLFPHGDLGWGYRFTYNCDHAEYLRYRMLMPEADLQMTTQTGEQITVNRFQLMSRIGQVYLVDTTSVIEENRLNYIRTHQAQLLGQEQEVDPEDNPENDDGQQPRRTFLPSSFTGSVRHLRKLASNALALVAAKGKPSVFITLTCNPRWQEITRELLDGQTAFDRPDISCRVFHAKLEVILQLIRQGEIFGREHSVEYEMRVIEFQFRGLPHAHIVMRLSGLPAENDVAGITAWVDRHISAVMPDFSDDPTIGSNEDRMYADLVCTHMTHQCRRGVNGCLNERNECAKRFPMPVTVATHFDIRGYPVYRRPTPRSSNVVPHNRKLLLLWQGHVDVEFAGHVLLVLYLYKYIFKGPDHARVEIREAAGEVEDDDRFDEIKRYVRARYLSSMECMWTTLRFHTYPSSSPPVRCVTVQMPNQLPEGDDISDMMRYFQRPHQLQNLRYTELFSRFIVSKQLPRYAQVAGHEHCSALIKGVQHFYYRRRNDEDIVCRMNTIYITAGEVWYLRLILLHRAIMGHIDARTVRGRVYNTFQEAAKACGLATDENEAMLCFRDSLGDATPRQLRGLFVLLTREGYPVVRIFNDEECRGAMMQDFLEREPSRQLAYNALLQDLDARMQDDGLRLTNYGLPAPDRIATELERELRLYDPVEQQEWIDHQPPPSPEQQTVVDAVLQAFESGERLMLFVQGKGGSGKTWLMRRLLAEIRARDGIAQVCAATGLAATLYLNGTTAHSLFRIPVEDEADQEDEEQELSCKLKEGSQRLELLQSTKLIVWDEFPNNHRRAFEAVFRAMKGFEGQILVASGDFRQIPPVVPGGDKWAVVDASIRSSPLWSHFSIFELTIAHRHAADPSYATFVQQLGEGVLGEDLYSPVNDAAAEETLGHDDHDHQRATIQNAKVVALLQVQAFSKATIDDAIAFAYPDLTNVMELTDRAILAATNDLVDEWNAVIQDKRCKQEATAVGAAPNAGQIHHLMSADVLTECDDERGHIRRMLTTEFLNSLNRPGIPPHDLQLAVGDICIVVRNLNKKDGLTNNRRVVVLAIQPFAVKVQTLGDHPKVFTLPRIRFKFRLPRGSFEVMRTQFPLRLGYCMTYNKSQGQELQAVLVDLRKPPFTHGHLYVALSRVRHRNGIAAFVEEEDLQYSMTPFTLNIVYPELLATRE